MPVRLDRNQAEKVLLNIEKNGGDATALRQALNEVSKKNRQAGRSDDLSDEDYVAQLKEKSPVDRGPGLHCVLCKKLTDELISGTCITCFTSWALSTRKK